MQKSSAPTAFILFTLLFVAIAVVSFAAFTNTEEICVQTENCLRQAPATTNGQMIWEVVSQGFLSLLSI